MVTIERYIPLVLKTGNQIGGRHWANKYGYRNKIFKGIQWYFLGKDRPRNILRVKVLIEITRVMKKGQRAFDHENLAWGMKPIPDFLKQNGWIHEDSPEWLDRVYNQVKSVDIGMKDSDFGVIIKITYPDECFSKE